MNKSTSSHKTNPQSLSTVLPLTNAGALTIKVSEIVTPRMQRIILPIQYPVLTEESPQENMRVFNMPAFFLEGTTNDKLPNGTVIISIVGVEDSEPKIGHLNAPTLRVEFSDVEKPLKHKNLHLKPISKENASAILNFITEQKPKTVLIHCAMGISRSASVALALHQILGAKLPKDFWNTALPKKWIIDTIVDQIT